MTEEKTVYERWNQFMDLLSAQPRRQIIVSLMDKPDNRALSLPEAAITPEIPVERERFEMKLRQIHVPMLADADYIRWSSNPFQVRRGTRFDEPASVMQVLLSANDQLSPSLVSSRVEESAGVAQDQ